MYVGQVYEPSKNSGVPKGRAGHTAFGTFREGDTLRSILPSKNTYKHANALCAEPSAPWIREGDSGCDFAIILVRTGRPLCDGS